ncbi:DoxX family protein [Cryptosporangium minutisporangium]|uniref:DoxX family membrane protein n=1 Tax=Cryptosporangium minutisporangium TaxID=113569 RepID=A0ABP6SYT3_9ACTN
MFDTVLLLIGPWLGYRLLGVLGIRRFADWRTSGAHALATMLLFTGAAHFAPDSVSAMPSHADLTAMVPPLVPFPDLMVYATGALELLSALGLVISKTRAATGIGLAVLFLLMLPANVYAAIEHVPLNGDPATPLVVPNPGTDPLHHRRALVDQVYLPTGWLAAQERRIKHPTPVRPRSPPRE